MDRNRFGSVVYSQFVVVIKSTYSSFFRFVWANKLAAPSPISGGPSRGPKCALNPLRVAFFTYPYSPCPASAAPGIMFFIEKAMGTRFRVPGRLNLPWLSRDSRLSLAAEPGSKRYEWVPNFPLFGYWFPRLRIVPIHLLYFTVPSSDVTWHCLLCGWVPPLYIRMSSSSYKRDSLLVLIMVVLFLYCFCLGHQSESTQFVLSVFFKTIKIHHQGRRPKCIKDCGELVSRHPEEYVPSIA